MGETENSTRSMGTEPINPTLVATLPHTSTQATPPSSGQSTQQPFQSTGPKTPDAVSTPNVEWPPATLEGKLSGLSKELLQLQEEMNTALEELLQVRASIDYHHRQLDLRAELAAHHNDTQPAKAKACHVATTTTLQWAHLDSITTLNCKAMAEKG